MILRRARRCPFPTRTTANSPTVVAAAAAAAAVNRFHRPRWSPPSRPPPRGGEARRTLSSFSSAAAAADAADSDNATPKKKKPKKRGPKSPKARKFGHLRQGKGLPATTSKEAGVRCDVIAHRGASGHLPGHTLPSMEEALRAGADWIELDVMPTKDGTLIVAHDVVLDHNTNAAEVFPGRARTKHAPANDDEDHNIHGFWVDDFTIDEIKQLDVGQSEQTRAQVSSLDTTSALGTLVAAHSFKVPTVVEAGAFVQGKVDELLAATTTAAGDVPSRRAEDRLLVPYTLAASRDIEAAFDRVVVNDSDDLLADEALIEVSGREYVIDFAAMVQRNAVTGHERPIFRLAVDTNGADGSDCAGGDGGGDGEQGEEDEDEEDEEEEAAADPTKIWRWFWEEEANPSVGLYIETKRPGYFRSVGLALEERLVAAVEESGFRGPVIIQSFEADSLKRIAVLAKGKNWQRVQLVRDIDLKGKSPEEIAAMCAEWATYAHGIGPNKESIIPRPLDPPAVSKLVDEAHLEGLFVHPYTFRSDTTSLHSSYGGNASLEFMTFFDLGVDGVFADFPNHGVFARNLYARHQRAVVADREDLHPLLLHRAGGQRRNRRVAAQARALRKAQVKWLALIEKASKAAQGDDRKQLQKSMAKLMGEVGAALDAEAGTLYLVDDQHLMSVAMMPASIDGGGGGGRAAASAKLSTIQMPLTQGIAGAVAMQGTTENIVDVYDDPRFSLAWDQQSGFRTRSMLCVPVKALEPRPEGGRGAGELRRVTVGVLQVLNCASPEGFDEEDVALAKRFAAALGNAISSLAPELRERLRARATDLHETEAD